MHINYSNSLRFLDNLDSLGYHKLVDFRKYPADLSFIYEWELKANERFFLKIILIKNIKRPRTNYLGIRLTKRNELLCSCLNLQSISYKKK